MHRLRLGLFRVAIVADAERIAAALRYQQELEAAQRPATMNPNLAAQGTSSRNRLAAALSSQNSNPIAEFARQAVSLDPQPDQGYGTMAAEMALGFVPGVGQAMAARDIERARRDNDPVGMGMAASSFVPFGKLIGGLRKPMSELITYHGSPHRFPPTANNPLGEFDPMKIGTGQGAQTYGHGLYVAENPKVAGGTEYRDPQGMFNRLAGGMNNREEFAHDMISQGRKPAEVFQIMKQKYGQFFNDRMLWADLDKVSSARGNLYKVDLADEQIPKMLDWDKPFNKQHPEVQQALVNIANGEDEGSKMLKLMQNGNPSGKDIFHSLLTEPQLIDSPSGWISVDNKKEISKLLQSEGIPGIRYLDQGSRAGGSGTSNFVVFDPKHMNIIGRE